MTENRTQFEKLGRKQFDLFLRDLPEARLVLFHATGHKIYPLLASHPFSYPIDGEEPDLDDRPTDTEGTLRAIIASGWNTGSDTMPLFHSHFNASHNQGSFILCLCPGSRGPERPVILDMLESLGEILKPILQTYPLGNLSSKEGPTHVSFGSFWEKPFGTQTQLTAIFDSIRQAIIMSDQNGTITFINSTALSLTGWEKHNATGQPLARVFQMIDPKTRKPVPDPFNDVSRTKEPVHSSGAKLVSQYGIELPMEYSASPLFDRGHFSGIILNFWDKTETYHERETMRRLKLAIDSSQDGFYITNPRGQFIYANKSVMDRLGAGPMDIFSKTIDDLIPDNQTTNPQKERSQPKGTPHTEFERMVTLGERTTCMLVQNYMMDYDNEPCTVGIVRDVSSLKQIQRELEDGRKTLSFLVEHINVVLYRYNLTTQRIFYAGMQSQEVLGIANEQWEDFNGWVKCLHPDDRETAISQIKGFISAGINTSFEYRIIDDRKQVRWVRDVLTVIKDGHGTPIEVVGFMVDISESKQREKELKDSKQRFETILDSVQTAIYLIDTGKQLIMVNKYCRQALGFDPCKPNGPDIGNFLPYEATSADIYDIFDKAIKTKEPQSLEHSLNINGTAMSAFTIFVPIFDGNGEVTMICGNSVDISKTKRVQKELEKVRERLNFALTAGNIGIWDYMVPEEKAITNSVFDGWTKQPCGCNDGEFSWLIRFIHPLDIGNLYKAYFPAKKGQDQSFECELRIKTGDDQYVWTLLQAKIVERNTAGEPTRIIGVHIDISRQKKLLLELSKAKEEAEKADKAKSLFLANLSHEIRTPMNAILGFAQIIEKQISDPTLVNYVESIKSGGKTLLNLINDILDLSKIEANKVTVKSEPVDVRHVATEMSRLFSYRCEQKKLGFVTSITGNVPAHVYMDELKFKQILINLISNAVKFTEKGTVALNIDFEKHLPQSGTLTMEVKDTGIGILPANQQTIFEPFMQHENHDSKKYGGTGLGLSITKKLTELMNGNISVDSQMGKGTTVSLVFKKIDCDKEYNGPEEQPSENNVLENSTLILVAQRPGGLENVLKHLIFQQMEVYEAIGFDAALAQVHAKNPDIVVVEAFTGATPDFFKEFMAQMKASKIPVLAYSHDHIPKNLSSIDGNDFDGLFCDPIMHDQLMKLFQKHVRPKLQEPAIAEPLEFNVKQAAYIVENTGDIPPLIGQLYRIHSSQQVKELAGKLRSYGNSLNYKPFADYAAKLDESIRLFDVEGIDTVIKTIDKHYHQLIKLANHE
ncbi:MAG: PAS domain S-box protein [Breznakibacter sp.]